MVCHSKPKKDEKKEEDKGNKAAAVPAQEEIKIAPPAEDADEPDSPPQKPAKVEIKFHSLSAALFAKHGNNPALYGQLKDLEIAKYVEKLPQILIKSPEGDEVVVEVIVIVSFPDSSDKLIHSGNFVLQATDNTTLKQIKIGISEVLEIHYEDMSIACGKRFLSDCRTLDYYRIFDGATVHLLVDTQDEIFENVFERLLDFGHDESVAAIATRSFIAAMNTKYDLDEGDNPILTEELLMFELGQFHVPLNYDSDDDLDESDDDNSIEEDEYSPAAYHIGGLEMLKMHEKMLANHNKNDNLIISDMQDNLDNEDDGNSDWDDECNPDFINENYGDSDSDNEEDDSDSDNEDDSDSDIEKDGIFVYANEEVDFDSDSDSDIEEDGTFDYANEEDDSDVANDEDGNSDFVIKDDGNSEYDNEGDENYEALKAFLRFAAEDTDIDTEDDFSDEEDSESDSNSDGL